MGGHRKAVAARPRGAARGPGRRAGKPAAVPARQQKDAKRGKRTPRAELPPGALDPEDGVAVKDEDLDVLDEYGGYLDGLLSINVHDLVKSTAHKDTVPSRRKFKSTLEETPAAVLSDSEDDDFSSDCDVAELDASGSEDDMDARETEGSGSCGTGENGSPDDDASAPAGEAVADAGPENSTSDSEVEMCPRRKRPRRDRENEEEEYEKAPRRRAAAVASCVGDDNKLPIKFPDGRIALQTRQQPRQVTEESSESEVDSGEGGWLSGSEAEESEHAKGEPVPPAAVSPQLHIAQMKEEMASVARKVIEDPEANVEYLSQLRTIAKDNNPTVRKLALLVQLSVYKDIIPGYRIRPLAQKEAGAPISKAVKKLRKFEQALLVQYQAYLQSLEASLNESGNLSVACVAAKCMCGLLDAVPHFNFRLNLMTAIVGRLASKQNTEIFNLCCNCVGNAFKEDVFGEVSLDAVRLITKMVKSKGFVVRPEVLGTFLHLRLRDELAATRNGGDDIERDRSKQRGRKRLRHEERKRTHTTQKAKKLAKLHKEVAKEMREAEAEVDKEIRQKNQSETLQHVFVCYFRILKHGNASPLLPVVLEGLAMFAHLINVDFFRDLLGVLKHIMVTGGASASESAPQIQAAERSLDAVPPTVASWTMMRISLLCIITAFQLLSGQCETLNIDLKDFYTHLYALLPRIALVADVESHLSFNWRSVDDLESMTPDRSDDSLRRRHKQIMRDFSGGGIDRPSMMELLLKGMDLLFLKRRQIPAERVAAFLKRMATISLQLPAQSVLECLRVIDELLKKFPKCGQLLASNDDKVANGTYHLNVDDPDACNPFATSLWELNLLTKHYDTRVRKAAERMLKRGSG